MCYAAFPLLMACSFSSCLSWSEGDVSNPFGASLASDSRHGGFMVKVGGCFRLHAWRAVFAGCEDSRNQPACVGPFLFEFCCSISGLGV